MKRPLILLVTLLAAAGCSKFAGTRLVGVWDASVGDMLEAAAATGGPVDPEKLADTSITAEFKQDRTFSFTHRTNNLERIDTGTWEATMDEVGRLKIRLITRIDGRIETKEGVVIFEDEDRCRVMPVRSNDPPLILKRKK